MINKLIAFLTGNTPEKKIIRQKLTQGARILDVRSEKEYAQQHIDGAHNVPMERLEQYAREVTDKTQPLIVHCAAGVRAEKAVKWLKSQGFNDVTNAGGLQHLTPLIQ